MGGGDAAATAAGTGAPRRAADSRDGRRDGRAGGRSTGRRRGPRRGGGTRGRRADRGAGDGSATGESGTDEKATTGGSTTGGAATDLPAPHARRRAGAAVDPRRADLHRGAVEGGSGATTKATTVAGWEKKGECCLLCSATATNDATRRGQKWIWGSKMPPPGAKSMLPGAAQRRRGWRRRIYTTWSSDSMSQMEACCIDRGPKGNIYRVHETPQTLEYVKRLNYP